MGLSKTEKNVKYPKTKKKIFYFKLAFLKFAINLPTTQTRTQTQMLKKLKTKTQLFG
jgi:hypothetical protein